MVGVKSAGEDEEMEGRTRRSAAIAERMIRNTKTPVKRGCVSLGNQLIISKGSTGPASLGCETRDPWDATRQGKEKEGRWQLKSQGISL